MKSHHSTVVKHSASNLIKEKMMCVQFSMHSEALLLLSEFCFLGLSHWTAINQNNTEKRLESEPPLSMNGMEGEAETTSTCLRMSLWLFTVNNSKLLLDERKTLLCEGEHGVIFQCWIWLQHCSDRLISFQNEHPLLSEALDQLNISVAESSSWADSAPK